MRRAVWTPLIKSHQTLFTLTAMTLLTLLILLYLGLLLWFGLKGNTHSSGLRGLLTTGGTTGALLCALSLVSTIIGGSATLGIGSLAQKIGAAAFWWLGVGAIGLVIHGFFIAPTIRESEALTLPDLLGRLAGPLAEKWAALIISISWIGITAAQFTALHALLASLTGNTGMTTETIYVALVGAIVLHTALGGQRGVIRTDALQAVLLLGGFLAAALWCVFMRADTVAALNPIPFSDKFDLTALFKMLCLVGITYVIGPDMFSRSFSARDGKAARRAALTAAPLLVIFGVIVTLLALVNIDAKQPISDWLSEGSSLPAPLVAVLALGLVSALSGSADTVLLSAAGIIEKDICGHERVKAVRLWVAGFGILAACAAWMSGDIIRLLLTAYSFFVPGVAAPMVLLVFGRLRQAHPALWLTGAVTGGICGIAGSLTGVEMWTYAGIGISFLGSIAAIRFARHCACASA